MVCILFILAAAHWHEKVDELKAELAVAKRNFWMTEKQKLYKSWIDACINESKRRLSKWEEEFLESISDQLTNRGDLSERQAEILERIYSEKT